MHLILQLAHRLSATRSHEDRGAALVEYALLIVLIAMVVVAALVGLGEGLSGTFSEIDSGVANRP